MDKSKQYSPIGDEWMKNPNILHYKYFGETFSELWDLVKDNDKVSIDVRNKITLLFYQHKDMENKMVVK